MKKGYDFSEETRRKMRERVPWNKGKINIYSKETIQKMSERRKGKKHSEETKLKMSEDRKGHIVSQETRNKITGENNSFYGKHHTEETKRKISETKKGKKLKLTDEQHLNRSLSRSKEKSHFWRGGISFEPYSIDWTNTLKRSIKERDKYTCQVCSAIQDDTIFYIHHVDYNKKNCNPNNLITLCNSCHSKTNGNRRDWENFFTLKMKLTKKS